MKKKQHRHSLVNILLFRINRSLYRQAYLTQISQKEYEDKGLPKYSIIDAVIDHLYGRKYFCVLISYPNMRVRGTKGKPIYETSTSIFFSYEEAWDFYESFHDDSKSAFMNTHQIISFRSKRNIPVWSAYRDNSRSQIY